MKRNIAFFFLMAFMNLLGTKAFAYDIAVENDDSVMIYYDLNSDKKTAEVVKGPNQYSGRVDIPDFISYGDLEYCVTSIGKGAFSGCYNPLSVTIPSSVKSIGQYAFFDSNGLESLVVDPENTTYDSRNGCNAIIESSTNTLLYGCKNTIIPGGVKKIGSYSFTFCLITTVNIPDGVTSIGEYAFQNCFVLSSITIPNSVTAIAKRAFWWSSYQPVEIISYIEEPTKETGEGFEDALLGATLYVPKGTLEKYKSADGWKRFMYIIEGIPSGINSVTMNEGEECERFDIAGKKLTEPQRGINIIRMTDGTTKKVVVK